MNLDHVLLVAREKSKNETDAIFLDMYNVFVSKFCQISNSGTYFKVINIFKAKMEALRAKSSPKMKNALFCSI